MTATPTRVNGRFQSRIHDQVSDDDESEEEIEDASISPILGHELGQAEASGLQNNSRIPVAVGVQEEFLLRIYEGVSQQFPDLSFVMSRGYIDSEVNSDTRIDIPVLTISQRQLFVHPPYGMVTRVQGYVRYKTYSVHVLMRLWRENNFENIADITALCEIICESSHYKFCPGINLEQYMREYYDVIRFHIKSVRLTEFPFQRVDSVNCKLLFELAHNASKEQKDSKEVRCRPCTRLVTDLEHQKRRTTAETPTRKVKRQHPSSRARLSFMSPASQAKRKKLAQYERTSNIRKLAKYEANEVTLDDEQNDEMSSVVENIGDEEVQKLCDEGEKFGIGSIMKDIWTTDLNRQRKEFSHDQASNCKLIYYSRVYV